MKTVVIGVGNSLFSDDGIGSKLVGFFEDFIKQRQKYQKVFFKDFEVKTIISESIDPFIVSKCRGFDRVIVVDAALIDKPPGQCAVYSSQDLNDSVFLRNTHNFSALDLARMIEKETIDNNLLFFKKVDLFCVSPKNLEFGETLSNELECSLPNILKELVLCVFKRF